MKKSIGRKRRLALCGAFCGLLYTSVVWGQSLPQVLPSGNGRFLQTVGGKPFFYLADTAWELFHRLNQDEADHYLTTRAHQGFNVIQAVAVAELDGLNVANANGDLPFVDFDPTHPNEPYWQHVDYIVRRANELGLYVGLLPTWGRYWHDGDRPLFNENNARRYASWLAERYKDAAVIWILGGDRMPQHDGHRSVIRAMAEGLRQGAVGHHLITYHPGGWCGSAQEFHGESWLAFNMRQNGHEVDFNSYPKNAEDYARTPAKPLIDGEAVYEDHPVAFRPDERGHTVAADCRRALYWDLFTGTCGHTYGHHSVWQMFDEGRGPVNRPLMTWRDAILQPGAQQMVHGKNLMLSRPYFTRVPATDEVLIASEPRSAWPGTGRYHFCATADSEGRYLMVYAPVGRKFAVRTEALKAEKIRLWWYNPRTGEATGLGVRQNSGQLTLCPPNAGEMIDWILVVDDASARFPKPGVPMKAYR